MLTLLALATPFFYDRGVILVLLERSDHENPGESDRIRRMNKERRKLSRDLGIDLPLWQDEAKAPPIDEDLIEAVLRKQFRGAEGERVARLIFEFRSWAEAYCRVAKRRE